MNEETKNFSALVLKKNLMSEEQVEECIAYQESMAAHGLEKPIWVLALEKGYLPQDRYKEVVQGVRWVGVRQKDRKFGELAVKKGFLIPEDLERALAEQEKVFSSEKKIRGLAKILLDQGSLSEEQKEEVASDLKRGDLPTVQAPVLEDTPTIAEPGVVGVDEVASIDDLMGDIVDVDAVTDLTVSDVPAEMLQPTIDEPGAEEAPPEEPAARAVGEEGPGVADEEEAVDDQVPTVIRKVKEEPEAEDEAEEAKEEEAVEETAAVAAPAAKKRKPERSKKDARTRTGERRRSKAAEARKGKPAPKSGGPPVKLLAGAAGGVGCLVVVVLLAVFVLIPALGGSGGSEAGSGEGGTSSGETEADGGETSAGEEDGSGEADGNGEEDGGSPDTGETSQASGGSGTPGETPPETPPETPAETAAAKLDEARSARSAGRREEALEILREVVEAFPGTDAEGEAQEMIPVVESEIEVEGLVEEGKRALDGGDLEEAERLLAQCREADVLEAEVSDLARRVESERAWRDAVAEGEAQLKAGELDKALETFRRARRLADRREAREGMAKAQSEIHRREGERATEADRPEEALRAFKSAVGALTAAGLAVPAGLQTALRQAQERVEEEAEAEVRTRAKALLREGKAREAASLLEAHMRRFGTDPALQKMLDQAREASAPPAAGASGKNEQGFPEKTNPKDGSVLVRIPEGEFVMGSDRGDRDQQPQRRVFLSGFWISKTEVTNEQFARFLNETGKERDEHGHRFVFSMSMGLKKTGADRWEPDHGYEKHPVIGVSWFGARAYCRWAGGDLPTEAQWEKAARGKSGARYPWGSGTPTRSRAVFGERRKRTEAVGSVPEGASPYGVLDMAGNVWEWCRDAYSEDDYRRSPVRNPFRDGGNRADRVLRGGSYKFSAAYLDPANRVAHPPATYTAYFGFRLVVDGS